MTVLFSILSLLCLIALVIGLIRPSIVIGRRNRKVSSLVYGAGFIVLIILVGATAPKQPTTHASSTNDAQSSGDQSNASVETAANSTSTTSKVGVSKLLAKQIKQDESYMRVDHDKVTGAVFYTDKTSPAHVNDKNAIYAYVATKKGYAPTLRIALDYVGSTPLIIRHYIFNIDGQNYEITPGPGQVKQNNNANTIWEWYDKPTDTNTQTILNAVRISKNAILRFQGYQAKKDITISKQEKTAIGHVIQLYEDLSSQNGN